MSVTQDLFSGAILTSDGGPSLVTEISDTAYTFNGDHDVDENWVLVSESAKMAVLQRTDHFSVSFWIQISEDSQEAYIFSFEMGTDRYFSLSSRSANRATFFYFRDRIATTDGGYPSRVGLSFYYNPDIFPNGLHDGKWHFIALTVDYPIATLTVDGYVYRPTEGHYFDSSDDRVGLPRLLDGSSYQMPAPILDKTNSQIEAINGYIGGSSRSSSRFSLSGSMRQLVLTDNLDTDSYNCLGGCGISIYSDESVFGNFSMFYNPAKRSFEFSSSTGGPEEYTDFLMSLLFSDNGFLPPEDDEESWRINVQVR